MKAVILCGGKGLRMSGAAQYSCKPLAEVGKRPLLWHIMKIYKAYGINQFVLCLGENGSLIKEYFLNLNWRSNDFHLCKDGHIRYYNPPETWDIIFADTGPASMTGGRIKRIEKYIDEDEFMLTYGDGLADIDLNRLLAFHRRVGKIATVTAIREKSGYGIIDVENNVARSFQEKPMLKGWVNGGFFVLNREVFRFIKGDSCIWENEPLRSLVREEQLAVYRHQGFWQAVDTAKDLEQLNEQWASSNRPWVKWQAVN